MNNWRTDKPPNEAFVEVELDGQIIEAMAFYGRDGYLPHWRLADGSCRDVRVFERWRHKTQPVEIEDE